MNQRNERKSNPIVSYREEKSKAENFPIIRSGEDHPGAGVEAVAGR